ncbi:MAG: hypothetical protein E7812_02875 [Phenylobacterium sp.]|nr:MAG: hypothetical protein E7812_02875 [Phenylobacterium sp.]
MRKTLAAGLAALTFGGAIAAAAIPATADARAYHGGYSSRGGGWDHRGNGGAALAAGIAGLAIGAAIADSGRPHYAYGYGYPAYGYGGYGVCETHRWTWDPYIGRRVLVTQHYAC